MNFTAYSIRKTLLKKFNTGLKKVVTMMYSAPVNECVSGYITPWGHITEANLQSFLILNVSMF